MMRYDEKIRQLEEEEIPGDNREKVMSAMPANRESIVFDVSQHPKYRELFHAGQGGSSIPMMLRFHEVTAIQEGVRSINTLQNDSTPHRNRVVIVRDRRNTQTSVEVNAEVV